MKKILGSWSGMRKYLEHEMLAESLRGRIRYGCTAYVGMDGCHIFEVCIDNIQVKRFSLETVQQTLFRTASVSIGQSFGHYWINILLIGARNIPMKNFARL